MLPRELRRVLPVSGAIHLAALLLIILWPHRPGPPGPPDEPGYQMMFDTAPTPNAVPVPGPVVETPQGVATAPTQTGADTPQSPTVNLFTDDERAYLPMPAPPPDVAPTLPMPPRPVGAAQLHPAGRPGARYAGTAGMRQLASPTSRSTLAPGALAAAGTTLSMGEFAPGGQASEATAHISSPGAHGDYDDMLFDYAARHLTYPEPAADNDESGTAVIKVIIARDGTVQDVRLLKSSIYRLLDLNTMEVFRNKKMPPLPDDLKGPTHEFTLAVDYILLHVYR